MVGGIGGTDEGGEGLSELIGVGDTCGDVLASEGGRSGSVPSLSIWQLWRCDGLFVSRGFPLHLGIHRPAPKEGLENSDLPSRLKSAQSKQIHVYSQEGIDGRPFLCCL